MSTQGTTVTPFLDTSRAASCEVSSTTTTGLAALIGKIRQIVRGEELRPIAHLAEEERRDLHLQARAVIRSQQAHVLQRAHVLALERAEQVITEEGFDAGLAARNLARRIAAEALLTHRLALEGTFDAQGGVQ